MPPPRNVAVIGAGLAGLTAAYRLSLTLPPSSKVILFEASHRVGGWVESNSSSGSRDGPHSLDGITGTIVSEFGPRSIRPRGGRGAARTLRLIQDLNLTSKIVSIPKSHPASKNRYILNLSKSGPKLELIRVTPSGIYNSEYIRSILLAGVREPFRGRHLSAAGDESVDAFFRRRFGHAVADNIASAFVHGIYAAPPEQLSLRSAFPSLYEAEKKYGSAILGMIMGTQSLSEVEAERTDWAEMGALGKERESWSMYGVKGGLSTITSALETAAKTQNVDLRLKSLVQSLHVTDNGVEVLSDGEKIWVDHVVSALPPPKLNKMLSSPLPHLEANRYTTVGVVNVVLRGAPSTIHPDGFGYLIPRSPPGMNPEGVLGVVFDSAALPGIDDTMGQNITKLTVMLGGPHWSSYQAALSSRDPLPIPSKAELGQLALNHLSRVLPVNGRDPLITIPNIHVNCIPTYSPGHGARLRELHEAIHSGPWRGRLSLVGSGYGGISVNDCVLSGEIVASTLAAGDSDVTGLERWASWV